MQRRETYERGESHCGRLVAIRDGGHVVSGIGPRVNREDEDRAAGRKERPERGAETSVSGEGQGDGDHGINDQADRELGHACVDGPARESPQDMVYVVHEREHGRGGDQQVGGPGQLARTARAVAGRPGAGFHLRSGPVALVPAPVEPAAIGAKLPSSVRDGVVFLLWER
ncbi:MAG: hypothetical protein M3417_05585 [Actinomycetota bacterium]|nr:hypothetical protein [Actinomycetota bacterium]